MIKRLWFEGNRIFVELGDGATLSRPLEAFPVLLEASEWQRRDFEISPFGDAVRWKELDEDIHLSSFERVEEPNPDNEIGQLFREFTWLNVSEVARVIGINKSLLAKYIYGIKTPSAARAEEIKNALRAMGEKLVAI